MVYRDAIRDAEAHAAALDKQAADDDNAICERALSLYQDGEITWTEARAIAQAEAYECAREAYDADALAEAFGGEVSDYGPVNRP